MPKNCITYLTRQKNQKKTQIFIVMLRFANKKIRQLESISSIFFFYFHLDHELIKMYLALTFHKIIFMMTFVVRFKITCMFLSL